MNIANLWRGPIASFRTGCSFLYYTFMPSSMNREIPPPPMSGSAPDPLRRHVLILPHSVQKRTHWRRCYTLNLKPNPILRPWKHFVLFKRNAMKGRRAFQPTREDSEPDDRRKKIRSLCNVQNNVLGALWGDGCQKPHVFSFLRKRR